jgi:hypothetical protein
MAVGGTYSSASTIFYEKVNVDHLGEDEYASRQKTDKINELVDLFPSFAGEIRHPPEIARALRSPAGPGEQPEQ